MVNLTAILFRKSPFNIKTDANWRRRQVLQMTGHLYGRSRNCFSLAIRRLHRTLNFATRGRVFRKLNMIALWDGRISSGCQELGYLPHGAPDMLQALARSHILLNRQSLANLAIWEPRTFKALNKLAATKAHSDPVNPGQLGPAPKGVITRGLLEDD